MEKDISIVIPIYNAAAYIHESTEALVKYCDQKQYDYEIVFCDDFSTDGSRQVICDLSQIYPSVRVRFNEENKGLGNTLRRLFHEARGKYVIYCDGDLPFGVPVIEQLLEKINEYDIIVASRYEGIRGSSSWLRKMTSRLYYYTCRVLFRVPVKDIGSGTVALRKEIIKSLGLRARGFDVHLEMYLNAVRQGLRIAEVPAASRKIETSSFRILKHGSGLFLNIIGLWISKAWSGSFKQ